MIDNEILKCFPVTKYIPRDPQLRILNGINKAVKKGKRFIIVQAPTGVGKSAISVTLLQYFKNGYICTGKKTLQAQYLNDFPFLKEVRGRANFTCKSLEDKKCDEGACKDKDFKCEFKPIFSEQSNNLIWKQNQTEKCQYWVNKLDAIDYPYVIHNYSYLIREANYIGGFKPRNVLILDEGHNVEQVIMDFINLEITDRFLDSLNRHNKDNPVKFVNSDIKCDIQTKLKLHAAWLIDINAKITQALSSIKLKKEEFKAIEQQALKELTKIQQQLTNRRYDSLDELKILEDKEKELKFFSKKPYEELCDDENVLSNLQKHQIKFFLERIHTELDNWIVKESRSKNGDVYKLQFQPIFIDPYAESTLFRLGKTVVIMSATILNPYILAKNLGIPLEQIEYIEEKTLFSPENNPIFNLGIADFSFYEKDTDEDKEVFYSQVVERIDLILDLFYNEKGIIHCTSYEILSYILKHSVFKDRLINHDTLNREEKLNEHINSKEPTVLCSPSMTEGVDLKDDLSRFQILIKVPYPDLKDERIKYRKNLRKDGKLVDPDFYRFKTATTIIQSIGRSIRSENDKTVTFTFDTRFESFLFKNKDIMGIYDDYVKDNSELYLLKGFKTEDDEYQEKLRNPDFYEKLLKYIPRKWELRNYEDI